MQILLDHAWSRACDRSSDGRRQRCCIYVSSSGVNVRLRLSRPSNNSRLRRLPQRRTKARPFYNTMPCYTKHGFISLGLQNAPCSNGSGYQQCCQKGDQCGAQGFCHFTHEQDDIVTGYYLGGCTDPRFKAAVCPQPCTQYSTQDVIYDSTDGKLRLTGITVSNVDDLA